jgi:hypothetical protein
VALASGDFNGDGIADLALSDAGSHVIAVLLGNGDGTFKALANYPVANGCDVGFLIVGDFNGDRKSDLLAVCESANQVFVYPGHGDGTFDAALPTQLPELTFGGALIFALGVGATIGDFNGDGKSDLVLLLGPNSTTPAPHPYLLLGNGDGTFGAAAPIESTAPVVAITTADFDGDQKLDLALLTLTETLDFQGNMTATQSLSILLGNGDGSFHAGPSYPWTGASFVLAAADLNGDGFPDLVAAGLSLTNAENSNGTQPPSQVTVMLGDGKGNFKTSFNEAEPQNDLVNGFCLANLHGNGPVDLLEMVAIADPSAQTASLGLGARSADGKGGFQDLVTITTAPNMFPFAAVCADFNGDGLTDAAYTGISFAAVEQVVRVDLQTLQQLVQIIGSLPAGSLYVSLNGTPHTLSFNNVNGASFATGPVAADSIVSAFWNGPANPKGIGINVTDATGTTRPAQVFYVSSKQINYAIPNGTATGNATITVTGTTSTYTSQAQIVAVAPGVFNASGLAVGSTLTVHNGKQTPGNLVEPDSFSFCMEPASAIT